jgi:hypothetical protein
MGSKSNVMVLADSLHHDDMRNISTYGILLCVKFNKKKQLCTVLKGYEVYGRTGAGAGISVRIDFFFGKMCMK